MNPVSYVASHREPHEKSNGVLMKEKASSDASRKKLLKLDSKLSEYKPGLEEVVASRFSICYVDGKKRILEYRGINIRELKMNSTFEVTSCLLLYSHLPNEREFNQLKILMANRR